MISGNRITRPVLYPVLPYDPTGSLLSYASRLSTFHLAQPLQTLLRDMGLSIHDLRRGEADTITHFAQVSGVPEGSLAAGAIQGRVSPVLRDGVYRRSEITNKITQYCPDCLQADGDPTAWRYRLFWAHRAATTCPLPSRSLIKVETSVRYSTGRVFGRPCRAC